LNYARNLNAVHLIKGQTGLVGVMLPDINRPYFSSLVGGMAQEALERNYQLILCQTGYQAEKERQALDMLKAKQIDGLIICSKILSWDAIGEFTKYGPLVACERVESASIASVSIDHYTCFQQALQLLIAKGHRRIGFGLNRPGGASGSRRRQAYLDAMAAIGENAREEWMFYECFTIAKGAEIVRRLASMKERPTALLVGGDEVAAGIMAEAGRSGLRIPQDLAVVGFDNQPIADVLGITTIDNQLPVMGRTAFTMLHEQITGSGGGPKATEIAFRIVERSTT
jgi:DNA-binding LacI/PurR family transcriptional regulator